MSHSIYMHRLQGYSSITISNSHTDLLQKVTELNKREINNRDHSCVDALSQKHYEYHHIPQVQLCCKIVIISLR